MKTTILIFSFIFSVAGWASDLKVGDTAPLFKSKTQDGKDFDLAERKGKWTVLYFYPKADTPGCTKQACAFRDSIQKIRQNDADIFGISVNSVEEQAAFHRKNQLNFTLLADPDSQVTKMYGTKMPVLSLSKRWTFILDPELKIRSLEKDVDPASDADRVAKQIESLKQAK